LNLPVKIVYGHLKKLNLKIPWKSLYTESVKVQIDGLSILVAPKSSIAYNADDDRKEKLDKKLKEVKKILEMDKAKKDENEKDDGGKQSNDTFTERIQLQVIRNIELKIANIHIRYEDDFTKPDHPFSAGFTLDGIEIKTTDDNWNPTFLKEQTIFIHKLINLTSFAIYCNSDETLLKEKSRNTCIEHLQRMISNDHSGSLRYILNPMSLTSKAVLDMDPKESNFMNPMFDIKILLETIAIDLNRLQYFDMLDTMTTIDSMALNAKYQKFKRITDGKKFNKWLFAYNAIIETQIKPKRDQYKWSHIKQTIDARHQYVTIMKKVLKSIKLKPDELDAKKVKIIIHSDLIFYK
jgi:vacuolar protein sorting-associated protein 13A/C